MLVLATLSKFNCSGTITPPRVISISQNLTLDGNNNIVTISGGNAHQVINVSGAANLTIRDLTIANGLNSGSGSGPAAVTVTGGGILFGSTGTLTIDKSNIINNSVSATNSGGAGNAYGGGIYNQTTGTVNIFNSTIANNSATGASTSGGAANGRGGGIYNSLTGAVNILNSTIALNTVTANSTGVGRGAGVLDLGGALTVINSTVTANTSSFSGTGTSQGGGLQLLGTGSITLKNTIVAGNNATQGPDVQAIVAITANSNNMIGNTNTLSGTGPSDIVNPASTRLGSLSNNGGPTQTVPLLAGSPVLGAGSLATCNTPPPNGPCGLDQRGATRGAASCNTGSFEGTLAIVPTKLVISTVPNSTAGANFNVTVTAEDNFGNTALVSNSVDATPLLKISRIGTMS